MLLFWNFLKSLSFGGLIGFGTFGLIFLCFQPLFSIYISILYFSLFGAALGSCLHQSMQWAIVFITGPIGRSAIYFSRVLFLKLQLDKGFISEENYKRIKNKLDDDFFLKDVNNNFIGMLKELKTIDNNKEAQTLAERVKTQLLENNDEKN